MIKDHERDCAYSSEANKSSWNDPQGTVTKGNNLKVVGEQ